MIKLWHFKFIYLIRKKIRLCLFLSLYRSRRIDNTEAPPLWSLQIGCISYSGCQPKPAWIEGGFLIASDWPVSGMLQPCHSLFVETKSVRLSGSNAVTILLILCSWIYREIDNKKLMHNYDIIFFYMKMRKNWLSIKFTTNFVV